MVNQCYDYLISNFGHIDIQGSLYLAELVNFNIDSKEFHYGEAYSIIADKYDTTSSAIERSIRHYISTIIEDKSLETICEMFDYPITRTDRISLKISEFVPLLRKKIRAIAEE